MKPDEILAEVVAGFGRRKFAAGLAIAFIDFLSSLDVPGSKCTSFENFLEAFPRQMVTNTGGQANTLIVRKPDGKTISLRPFYDAVERFFRAEHKRFDYPSAAPHATQAWTGYRHWLDAMVTFKPKDLAQLKDRIQQFVLERLASQEFDPSSIEIEPPLFKLLIENFDKTSQRGEPTGAPFQGMIFGFLRADNPHLQIEIDKVRTGSKRLQRIGDVDGWEGARLAISAEVKQFILGPDNVPDLQSFANATGRRGALGVVAALGFAGGVRDALEALGVIPLDTTDLLRIVELWDPIKQRTAVSSFIYYARHVEKNASLAARIDTFLTVAAEEWISARKAAVL